MREFEPERDRGVIEEVAADWARSLEPNTLAALAAYVEQVAIWNQKINLTGAREPRALCEVLLTDAFAIASEGIVPERARVLDVGTGAGAPIVPLLLLRPDLRALCVEPLHKRVTFLRMLSARLGLVPRLELREIRIDPAAPESLGESCDLACSRATFAPDAWLPLGLRLAPRVLVLLGDTAAPALPSGARLAAARAYALPFSRAPRTLLLYLRE